MKLILKVITEKLESIVPFGLFDSPNTFMYWIIQVEILLLENIEWQCISMI